MTTYLSKDKLEGYLQAFYKPGDCDWSSADEHIAKALDAAVAQSIAELLTDENLGGVMLSCDAEGNIDLCIPEYGITSERININELLPQLEGQDKGVHATHIFTKWRL
jgi:hypothetical protein